MKVCTCFLLFGIIAQISTATRIRTKVDHRGVNPAIENVSELINEEYSGDTKIFDKVHNFRTSETIATDKNKNKNPVFRAARVKSFTDFIQDAVDVLNTYEDTAFEDFFHILDHEIRRYHYPDCKFAELTQNRDTRSLMAGALIIIRGKSVSFMKANINEIADMMRDETYGSDVTELLDYINSLYSHTDQKFHRVLKELKLYRKTKSIKAHNNLVKVIKQGVRDIFFDHYSALDSYTRLELKVRIEKFWNRFKNNQASSAEVNNSHKMNSVSESVIDSITISKNVMNEDRAPGLYSKNNKQINLINERNRKSKEERFQQPQNKETEKDVSSNESEKRNTDTDTPDDISSGQSLDSSSNSIKQSQERQAEYNTNRYMTLYTEKISYNSWATENTEIIPISASEITKRATGAGQTPTTSAPRNSSKDKETNTKKVEVLGTGQDLDVTKHDVSESEHGTKNVLMVKSKPIPRVKQNDDKRKKHGKSKSKKKPKNTHFIGEYNAVIDVQLDNTALLKSLGVIKPVSEKNSRSFKQTKPVPTKPKINSKAIVEPKAKKPTALPNPLSRYSRTHKPIHGKPFRSLISNISTLMSNESQVVIQLVKGKKPQRILLTRRNANNNNTIAAEDFNKNVIKRIDGLEQDLQQLKQIVNVKSKKYDNYTDQNAKGKVGNKRNIKLKYNVERLMKEYEDMNNRGLNKTNNYGNSTMNTESTKKSTTYHKQSVINKDVTITTIIDDKNISQVTKKNVEDTKTVKRQKNDNSKTTVTVSSVKVTDTTELEAVMTTATAEVIPITEGSQPSYYADGDPNQNPFLQNGAADPFGLISDGLNNNNYGI